MRGIESDERYISSLEGKSDEEIAGLIGDSRFYESHHLISDYLSSSPEKLEEVERILKVSQEICLL